MADSTKVRWNMGKNSYFDRDLLTSDFVRFLMIIHIRRNSREDSQIVVRFMGIPVGSGGRDSGRTCGDSSETVLFWQDVSKFSANSDRFLTGFVASAVHNCAFCQDYRHAGGP